MTKTLTQKQREYLSKLGSFGSDFENVGNYRTMIEIHTETKTQDAATIARKLFGCWDWQGAKQSVSGASGLEREINKWMKGHGTDSHWYTKQVKEVTMGDFTSLYYIRSF